MQMNLTQHALQSQTVPGQPTTTLLTPWTLTYVLTISLLTSILHHSDHRTQFPLVKWLRGQLPKQQPQHSQYQRLGW